jgi:enoyl-[acyl-carrier protein] reductase II
MRTRLCDLLDIRVPIIGAPFGPWNSVKLAAAICEAGGLGSLGTVVRPVEQLKQQWAQLRELTDRPFAINHQPRPFSPEAFEATLEARPAVISYHMGDPGDLVDRAHLAGSLWMQQVMDVDQARRAVECRADIIVAQGSEAGGHSGFVSTLVLVPQVVEIAADLPVVAAGGIADGRGLAAALCLGASGVVMGTRLLASTEMAVHPAWKEMILHAESRDARHSALTDLILPPYNRPHDPAMARVLPTAFAEQWSGRPDDLAERAAALAPAILNEILSGGGQDYVPFAGQSVGLIHDIRPAGDIVRHAIEEAEQILSTLVPESALRI